jgi:xanthine dehydrogenase accessory factor
MDRRLTREALRLMEAHQPFVRATVVRTSGSVPGKQGASMLIRADGSFLGTVGGAALEERVKELAQTAFTARTGDLHHFDLQAWKAGGLPSLCGGSVDIALEYVPARPNILLWGGGHVAHSLATLLPTLEYDYSVADDRADWVGVDRFPTADRREVVAPEDLWTRFEPASFTHLFLLGYDARKDLEVLVRAVSQFPNTIGLIASAAKREHMFSTLRDRGVHREAIARIHSPVGVEIGAQSPAEIAVSMVAELVQEMHPTSLPTRSREGRPSPTEDDVVSRTS